MRFHEQAVAPAPSAERERGVIQQPGSDDDDCTVWVRERRLRRARDLRPDDGRRYLWGSPVMFGSSTQ